MAVPAELLIVQTSRGSWYEIQANGLGVRYKRTPWSNEQVQMDVKLRHEATKCTALAVNIISTAVGHANAPAGVYKRTGSGHWYGCVTDHDAPQIARARNWDDHQRGLGREVGKWTVLATGPDKRVLRWTRPLTGTHFTVEVIPASILLTHKGGGTWHMVDWPAGDNPAYVHAGDRITYAGTGMVYDDGLPMMID